MKLELKSDNENYLKSFSNVFKTVIFLTLIILFCDVALKLGIISRFQFLLLIKLVKNVIHCIILKN